MKAMLTLDELKQVRTDMLPNSKSATLIERKIREVELSEGHERMQWRHYAPMFGLKDEHFGKQFVFRGRRYELTGVNPGAHKYPFDAKRLPDGKTFRFPKEFVLSGLRDLGIAA